MNAQQLKNAILQEAIEGRLVPQDPNDEPASALLARIRKEKEQLVKAGKLKKKDLEVKPISEDEIPFEIPESWKWCKLDTITTVLGGKRIPAGRKLSQENTGHIYIRVSDMKEDSVSTENLLYVPEDIFPSISRYIINKEDVYITVAGTIGRIGKIPPELNGANLTENADRLVFRNINQDWLIRCLQSPFIQLQITDVTTKVGQPKLAILRIQNLLIPLPPLAEQQRIVAKIEELLPKVEEYGQAQDALNKLNEELPERLKKSILQEAIEGRLVPQDPTDEPASVLLLKIREEKQQLVKAGKLKKKDLIETPISEDEIPFEIPDTWEWVRMQSVMEFINGRAYKKDELLEKGKYKVLRVGNLFTNDSWYFSNLELSEDKYCYDGDLLYAWSASFGPHIWEGEKTIFHYHIWNVKYNQCVLYREYLYYFFLIDKMKIKGSTTGSTMVHVSMENMKPRLIPLPPLAEQKRIVAKIEQLLGEIDKLKK